VHRAHGKYRHKVTPRQYFSDLSATMKRTSYHYLGSLVTVSLRQLLLQCFW